MDLTGLEDKSTRSLKRNSGTSAISRTSGNTLLLAKKSPALENSLSLHQKSPVVVTDPEQVVVTVPEDESKAPKNGQNDQVMHWVQVLELSLRDVTYPSMLGALALNVYWILILFPSSKHLHINGHLNSSFRCRT